MVPSLEIVMRITRIILCWASDKITVLRRIGRNSSSAFRQSFRRGGNRTIFSRRHGILQGEALHPYGLIGVYWKRGKDRNMSGNRYSSKFDCIRQNRREKKYNSGKWKLAVSDPTKNRRCEDRSMGNLKKVLEGQDESCILPFLWLKGEDNERIREELEKSESAVFEKFV